MNINAKEVYSVSIEVTCKKNKYPDGEDGELIQQMD
jgi:hypothetical protein